ncbi:hypothetical protein CP556_07505 [Natrinema sp. CBA1119]|uniref:hypothetical protein n=1 Tax=Natrinema sp. CBA1119 TaxID=1608465 RepID=UPI000BF45585|nr:hypothetical protein [Natrinema sp. CBA1119]PGF15978.1 hypothetical protein CP556_07505 [Natrinema sp. CBA1119]
MSTETDSHRSLEVRAVVSAALRHPLLGLEPRRTALAGAYLLGLIATVLASYVGARVPISDSLRTPLTSGLDTLSLLVIALVTATMLLAPLCYAVWNGGPLLSFGLPLVPVAVGDTVAGAYVLDLDLAVALTVGASAAALALLATDVRQVGSVRFWRAEHDGDDDRLLFVTALATVTAVGVGRFVGTAPSYVLEWYAPMGAVWLVTAAVLGSYWLNWARSAWHARSDRSAGAS